MPYLNKHRAALQAKATREVQRASSECYVLLSATIFKQALKLKRKNSGNSRELTVNLKNSFDMRQVQRGLRSESLID